MQFAAYTKRIEDVFTSLQSSKTGLTVQEANTRLGTYGPNELSAKQTRWYHVFARQFASPFLYLLVAAAVLSAIFGEYTDGAMIGIFIAINTILGFYQEFRSEKALALLRRLVISRSRVVRGSEEILVESTKLVPGDVIILEPGDNIPADVRFVQTEDFLVNESVLTGESTPVSKDSKPLAKETNDVVAAANIGFSATTVDRGKATAVVIATGKNTQMGEIAVLTAGTHHASSFEKGIQRFSTVILHIITITIVAVVILNIVLKGSQIDIPTLLVFAIALAVSVIPEALPVVMTFSLSRGALALAKQKVVVKRLSAIEDLGSIEVLCTDKTGTLTQSQLHVAHMYPEKNEDALFTAALANDPNADKDHINTFDGAILTALPASGKRALASYKVIAEEPFDPLRRRNSVVVNLALKRLLVVRGAPEEILPLCTGVSKEEKERIRLWIVQRGTSGQRTIAVAKRTLTKKPTGSILKEEHDLTLVGLIAFTDPIKPSAYEAVATAKQLGVTIKILTGDSPEVAGAVAHDIGLISDPQQTITGQAFENLSQEAQHETVEKYSVFARVTPQQKYQIIELLKEKYEVGFLGEGINDAPSLKAANVAIVVESASDISREAADIILLQKSLHVVVEGIKQGREIFANTTKYIKATLASNFGNFYTIAITSLFVPFLPLLPVQILLLNLLTDFPMIAVATDTVDQGELRRPKNYNIRGIILVTTLLGVVSSFFDFMIFVFFYRISPAVLQTNWAIASILTELVFLFSIRTRLPAFRANPPSKTLILLSAVAVVTAITLPFTGLGQGFFRFTPPQATHMILIILTVVLYFITTEIVKLTYYRKFSSAKDSLLVHKPYA